MMKKIFLSMLLSLVCLFATAQPQTITHIVQRGETLESIAEHYSVSVDDIIKANPNTDGMFYVGMKLAVPVGTVSATPKNATQPEPTEQPDSKSTEVKSTSTKGESKETAGAWERNEPRVMLGLTYFAQDFDDVKASGHYGLTLDVLNIGGSLFGFDITMGSFNYGLVDKNLTYDMMLFGPNVSYEVAQNLILSVPAQVLCSVYFGEKSKTETTWGWAISPRAYYSYGRVSIHAGIMVNGFFKNGDSVTCGFITGIGFSF